MAISTTIMLSRANFGVDVFKITNTRVPDISAYLAASSIITLLQFEEIIYTLANKIDVKEVEDKLMNTSQKSDDAGNIVTTIMKLKKIYNEAGPEEPKILRPYRQQSPYMNVLEESEIEGVNTDNLQQYIADRMFDDSEIAELRKIAGLTIGSHASEIFNVQRRPYQRREEFIDDSMIFSNGRFGIWNIDG